MKDIRANVPERTAESGEQRPVKGIKERRRQGETGRLEDIWRISFPVNVIEIDHKHNRRSWENIFRAVRRFLCPAVRHSSVFARGQQKKMKMNCSYDFLMGLKCLRQRKKT
ncbi:hypothetical protein EYF80_024112 [Liparis tanakae]|uniref:Uncharacterized protein n=1 Tax=Liparis tanakae TaxID=230148 RepID=A0A4Z2HIS1_9TELE|nr:hypothetical protein EYF80_024112 [Liparis tanakae]